MNHAFLIKLNDMKQFMVYLGVFRKKDNKEIHQTINNFIFRNISLPLLNTDISNLLKFSNIPFCSAISIVDNKNLHEGKNKISYVNSRQI